MKNLTIALLTLLFLGGCGEPSKPKPIIIILPIIDEPIHKVSITPPKTLQPSEEEEIYISCRVIDRSRTKTEKYRGYSSRQRVTIFQEVPDEKKLPIFFNIKGSNVNIESSIGGSKTNITGAVKVKNDREIKIRAERNAVENWKITIDRVTGSIKIFPMGVLGVLENIARVSENKAIREYEGFCEDGSLSLIHISEPTRPY